MKINKCHLVILVPCILFLECTTILQKSGVFLEGRAFEEKNLSVYRSAGKPYSELHEIRTKNNDEELVITSDAFPGLRIFGKQSSSRLDLTRAEFLSTHVRGWNEFTLELAGEASIADSGGRRTLNITVPSEGIRISGGRIRYRDSRISGNDALRNLANRRERILALTDWMKTKTEDKSGFDSQKDFDQYWKRLLFPELIPKSKRPQQYSEDAAQWTNGNGVKWNQSYTGILFPEELREYRDSGALLQDWEEAVSWIYLEYSWNTINEFFNGMEFIKIK